MTSARRLFLGGVLVALIAIGAHLRLQAISYPAVAVGDEVHFASYASQYAHGIPVIDIHPPLGKLIYAGVLATGYPNAPLLHLIRVASDKAANVFFTERTGVLFGDFPYVGLRVVSGLFGACLPLSIFLFLRALKVAPGAAVGAAVAVVFENAFILDSRLILLNMMYLVLGFFFLVVYFSGSRAWHTFFSGILWGLALSVKLIAIVFVAPVLAALALGQGQERERAGRNFFITTIIAFGVLAFFYIVPPALLSSADARLVAWQNLGILADGPARFPSNLEFARPATLSLIASVADVAFSAYGYTTQASNNAAGSSWYQWFLLGGDIDLYDGALGDQLRLSGNPVVWYATTGAVLAVLFWLAIALYRARPHGYQVLEFLRRYRVLVILLAGYLGSIAPFVLVGRTTYLYHYYPAYLFGIGILALAVWAATDQIAPHSKIIAVFLRGIFLFSILAGFLYRAPVTFGIVFSKVLFFLR